MPRKPRRAHLDRDNATRRVSLIIRAKGYCERCQKTYEPLEHAHAIRRRYSWTRTDERNGWALCHACHQIIDREVTEFNKLVTDTMGWDLYSELEQKSRRPGKFDWSAELDRLKALQKELSS